MSEKDEIILDQPEHEKPPADRWRFLIYISLAIFAAGIIGLMVGHPAAPMLLAAALAVGHLRSTLSFASRDSYEVSSVFYFVGRTLLVMSFIFWFIGGLLNYKPSLWMLGATALCFVISIFLSGKTNDDKAEDDLD